MATEYSKINPATVEGKTGDIKIQKSLLKQACDNDFEALKNIFQQFIPEDEIIYDARYLGIEGFLGFGTHQFACVTDRRIADITVGYFGEMTYQDGYLEHIQSVFIYHPNKLILYILTFMLTVGIAIAFQPISLGMLIKGMLLGLIVALITLQFFAKIYYQIFKSGLVLTVREGEVIVSPYANNIFLYTNRLIYIFTDRKFLTRANALYREFIIRREERLNLVQNYPLPESTTTKKNNIPELTPLSSSPLSVDEPENNIPDQILISLIVTGLGAGVIWGLANFVIPKIQLQKATDLVNEGNKLQASEDYEAAIAAYNQAIEIKPEFADAWIQKCLVFNILQKSDEAISACTQAIQIAPYAYLLWKEKGDALLALNRQEEALASYQKATEIKSNYSLAWYNQGLLLKQMGKPYEALESFDNAIQGDGDFGQETIADAWGEKCYMLAEQRRYDQETFTACNHRVELVSTDYLAWKERGNSLNQLGQKEEALASYQKAIEIKSTYSAAWFNAGIILKEMGELNIALNAINNAIEGDGDFGKSTIAIAWRKKCDILLDLNQFQEAVLACNQIGVNITNATVVGDPRETKNVRDGITTDTKVLFELPINTRVRVFDSMLNSDNYLWYKIYSPQHQQVGWIASHLIQRD